MRAVLYLFLLQFFVFILPSYCQDSSTDPNAQASKPKYIQFYLNPLFQKINFQSQLERVTGRPVSGLTDDGGPAGRPGGGLTDSIQDGTSDTSMDNYGRPTMGLSDSTLDGTNDSSDYGRPSGGLSDPFLDGEE